ncbi:MAG TPA: hypothetical protein VMU50_12650 [Polyangia bacterium]|nr:hypothetical protein [Polyangia bacterium]
MPTNNAPAWRRRTSRASVALQAGITVLTFLSVYGLLHLLHVAGIDLGGVARWISIPLFAHTALAAAAALASIAVGRALVRARRLRSRWLPVAFAVGPALFSLAIVLFP